MFEFWKLEVISYVKEDDVLVKGFPKYVINLTTTQGAFVLKFHTKEQRNDVYESLRNDYEIPFSYFLPPLVNNRNLYRNYRTTYIRKALYFAAKANNKDICQLDITKHINWDKVNNGLYPNPAQPLLVAALLARSLPTPKKVEKPLNFWFHLL